MPRRKAGKIEWFDNKANVSLEITRFYEFEHNKTCPTMNISVEEFRLLNLSPWEDNIEAIEIRNHNQMYRYTVLDRKKKKTIWGPSGTKVSKTRC